MKRLLFLLALLLVCLPAVPFAAEGDKAASDLTKAPSNLVPVIGKLRAQQGTVTLGAGLASFTVPKGLGYLSPEQTDILLHKVYGFSWSMKNLGAIVPVTVDIGSDASWYTLITYREDGRVDDTQALNLDKNSLLSQLQTDNAKHNTVLKKQGMGSLSADINGWAAAPVYDAANHKLRWAVEFTPQDSKNGIINYHIRLLGRSGTIAMTMIGALEQLPMFEDSGEKIFASMAFNAPHRYEDFNQLTDGKAPYGAGDLILARDQGRAKAPPSLFAKGGTARILLIFLVFIGALLAARKLLKRKK